MIEANKNMMTKNIIIGILAGLTLFSSVIVLSYSTTKIVILFSILITIVGWLLSFGKLRRVLKHILIIGMISTIGFTTVEAYAFENTISPPIYLSANPEFSVSYPEILNASISEIIQNIEQSSTFEFLKIEHPGKINFESLKMDTTLGTIKVDFYADDSAYIKFHSKGTQHEVLSVGPYIGTPLSQLYPGAQAPKIAFAQIDEISISWFFQYAMEQAKNRTGTIPSIDNLQVSLQFERQEKYQGITLLIIGYSESLENDYISGKSVLIAEFQPDGKLIYMSEPKSP